MAKSKKSAPSQSNKRQNNDESDISQTIGPEAKKQKSDQLEGNSFDKACYLTDWKLSWRKINDHAGLPEQSLDLQHWIYIEGITKETISTQNANLKGKQQFENISKAIETTVIVERLSRIMVKDINGQIFRLIGKSCDLDNLDFSPASIDKFMNGFPEDWASIIAEECYLMYQYPKSQDQGTELIENQTARISSNFDDEDENMSDRSSTLSYSDSDDDESYAPQESLDNHESKVFQHQPFPAWIFENLNYQITHATKILMHDKDEPEVEEVAYRLIEIAEQAKEERNKVLNEDAHIDFLSSHQKRPALFLDGIIKKLEKEIKHIDDTECKGIKGPNICVIRRRLYDILCHLWLHIN